MRFEVGLPHFIYRSGKPRYKYVTHKIVIILSWQRN